MLRRAVVDARNEETSANGGDHSGDNHHADNSGTAEDHPDHGDRVADKVAKDDKTTPPRTPWTVPVLLWRDPATIPPRGVFYRHASAPRLLAPTHPPHAP